VEHLVGRIAREEIRGDAEHIVVGTHGVVDEQKAVWRKYSCGVPVVLE
jgi:hypothetical protein